MHVNQSKDEENNMTRQINLVNLSNWDHEDYIVEVIPSKPTDEGKTMLLKPGDHTSVYPIPYKGQPSVLVRITAVEKEEPKPFYKDGTQIVPRLTVTSPYPEEK